MSDREDAKEVARGGRKELFTVPYFLSQHPLSSRGKSIFGVKGHTGGILFVLSSVVDCRACGSREGIFKIQHEDYKLYIYQPLRSSGVKKHLRYLAAPISLPKQNHNVAQPFLHKPCLSS